MARLDELAEGVASARRENMLSMKHLTKAEVIMVTYREIIDSIRETNSFAAQTCWIADVKASHGLTRGKAPNRLASGSKVKPCPPHRRAAIERALMHFGMV